jgi:hypothetical protein
LSRRGWSFSSTSAETSPGGAAACFKGESLRSHHEPTLAALLERRVREVQAIPARCKLAHALVTWDPLTSEPATHGVFAELARGELAGMGGRTCLTQLTLARVAVGHRDALRDYTDWLALATPSPTVSNAGAAPTVDSSSQVDVFRPLLDNLTDEHVKSALELLFAPGSRWLPRLTIANIDAERQEVYLVAIALPVVRKRMLEWLEDQTVIANAEIEEEYSMRIDYRAGRNEYDHHDKLEPILPPVGTKQQIRVADYVAWQLTRTANLNATKCRLFWPKPARDERIAGLKEVLRAIP